MQVKRFHNTSKNNKNVKLYYNRWGVFGALQKV